MHREDARALIVAAGTLVLLAVLVMVGGHLSAKPYTPPTPQVVAPEQLSCGQQFNQYMTDAWDQDARFPSAGEIRAWRQVTGCGA